MFRTDNTAFPASTNAYGAKTRYEIRRSTDSGKSSVVVPSDQRQLRGKQWAYDTLKQATDACDRINRTTGGDVANDRYKILDYTIDIHRTRVYILAPGQFFCDFGGSRHGLVVRKTPSLIIRRTGHDLSDYETDVTDVAAWSSIEVDLRLAGEEKTTKSADANPDPTPVYVYRSKGNPIYWFMRVDFPTTDKVVDLPIPEGKANELRAAGAKQLEDGGGL